MSTTTTTTEEGTVVVKSGPACRTRRKSLGTYKVREVRYAKVNITTEANNPRFDYSRFGFITRKGVRVLVHECGFRRWSVVTSLPRGVFFFTDDGTDVTDAK